MVKLRENGLNIDYMYETNSVLRKTAETEISDLTFWLRFCSVRVFINRNRTEIRFPHIPSYLCNSPAHLASDCPQKGSNRGYTPKPVLRPQVNFCKTKQKVDLPKQSKDGSCVSRDRSAGGSVEPTCNSNNNNNNNNKHDNVYGAVIMADPLREFTRFI